MVLKVCFFRITCLKQNRVLKLAKAIVTLLAFIQGPNFILGLKKAEFFN